MSCFKREVDLYVKRVLQSPNWHVERAPTLGNNDQQSVVAYENTQSPDVSDTPLILPRGSLPSEDTVYPFEPPPPTSFSTTTSESVKEKEDSSQNVPSINDFTLPLVRRSSPPPLPDAFLSAAIAYGASEKTAQVVSGDPELYALLDPIFDGVASMNSTLREISDDITSFTKRLEFITEGLRLIQTERRETIQYNLPHQRRDPKLSAAYSDNIVRLWLHELVTEIPWTNEAWQEGIFRETKIFADSLQKLKDTLNGRLSYCEQVMLNLQDRILGARGPLVTAKVKAGEKFGEPWLDWALNGIARLKRFVARLGEKLPTSSGDR